MWALGISISISWRKIFEQCYKFQMIFQFDHWKNENYELESDLEALIPKTIINDLASKNCWNNKLIDIMMLNMKIA